MKNILNGALIGLMLTASACSQKETGILEVTGTIANLDKVAAQYPQAIHDGNITLFLYQVPFGGDLPPVQLDSVSVSAQKRSFTLKGPAKNIGIYNIVINNGPMLALVNDASSMTVDMDFAHNRFYTVKGSPASTQLEDFIFTYEIKNEVAEQTMTQLDSLHRVKGVDSSLTAALINRRNTAIADLNAYMKKIMNETSQPVVAAFVLGRSGPTLPTAEFEAELSQLLQKYPVDPNVAEIKKRYEAYKQQIAKINEQQQQEILWVGKKAPDLTLPDINGKPVSLSSFKGKYVLVDFWASWCNPCRAENPNVVAAYNKYKQKNFAILGVSLDNKKEKWLEAIKSDQLKWTQVSDLAFWDSKAVATFGFNSIPYNVLIDPEGNVIGEALRGEALDSKLKEVLQ